MVPTHCMKLGLLSETDMWQFIRPTSARVQELRASLRMRSKTKILIFCLPPIHRSSRPRRLLCRGYTHLSTILMTCNIPTLPISWPMGALQLLLWVATNIHPLSPSEAQQMIQESDALYNRLYIQALSGDFDRSSVNYANSVAVSEFLEYQLLHNETLLHSVSQEDIRLARWYADQYTFATNGNADSSLSSPIDSSAIRTIAGQTLAGSILDAFDTNALYRGNSGKLTFVFGGYEPAVALTSLVQLASPANGKFYGRPALGASLTFELFSLENQSFPTYPDPSQLYVRFLLRNGTTSPEFQSYPLFGHSPSSIEVPYSEFKAEMQAFSLNSTQEWCLLCDSTSSTVFCPGVLDDEDDGPSSSAASSSGRKGISPAVGGVIGAIVTLVVVGLLAAAGFLLLGVRVQRGRRASLEEIKGGIDLGSESNLALREHAAPPGKTARP
ncbi:hypothetical protein ACMYSQ_000383 [Aspergillus niger]